jgi:Short C-terminal domain
MAGTRALSIPEQIEKLDELRTRGVVSQAEFDAKKQQLLDQM